MCEYSGSNSYKQLSKLAEPEMFGEIVGTGYNSIIIEPSSEYWQFNVDLNSVLIFSMEKEKQEFLKKMFGNKVKCINYRKLPNKNARYYLRSVKDTFSVFFMEKLREVNYDKNNYDSFGLMQIINNKLNEPYHKSDIFWLIEEIKIIAKENKHRKGVKDFIKAIIQSLKALEKTTIDSLFRLDFHKNQFMIDKNNKIVCIDPVWFNY